MWKVHIPMFYSLVAVNFLMKTSSLNNFKIWLTDFALSAKVKCNRKFQISLCLLYDQVFNSSRPN